MFNVNTDTLATESNPLKEILQAALPRVNTIIVYDIKKIRTDQTLLPSGGQIPLKANMDCGHQKQPLRILARTNSDLGRKTLSRVSRDLERSRKKDQGRLNIHKTKIWKKIKNKIQLQ